MKRCYQSLLFAVTFAAVGCQETDSSAIAATQPPDIAAVANSIVTCQTTDSTLLGALGDPSRNGILHGERIMTWLSTDPFMTRYLGVLLDSSGTVVDMYWDVPTEVPWVPTSQCR